VLATESCTYCVVLSRIWLALMNWITLHFSKFKQRSTRSVYNVDVKIDLDRCPLFVVARWTH
jgi:hypothetical protein